MQSIRTDLHYAYIERLPEHRAKVTIHPILARDEVDFGTIVERYDTPSNGATAKARASIRAIENAAFIEATRNGS